MISQNVRDGHPASVSVCNLAIKGEAELIRNLSEQFLSQCDGDMEEDIEENGNVACAKIIVYNETENRVAPLLKDVKWTAFIEDFSSGVLFVGKSDIGSDVIDEFYFIDEVDLSGDDRIASQYYPTDDFDAKEFDSRTGEPSGIYYEFPFKEWWETV